MDLLNMSSVTGIFRSPSYNLRLESRLGLLTIAALSGLLLGRLLLTTKYPEVELTLT